MNKYYIFTFLVLIAIIFGGYKYIQLLNNKIDLREATIEANNTSIEELSVKLINAEAMIVEQTRQLSDNVKQFDEYKNRVTLIKDRVIKVPVYTEIVKIEPAEVIILKANEGTNAIINNINNHANAFAGMYN